MLKKYLLILLAALLFSHTASAEMQEPNIYTIPRPAPTDNFFNRYEQPIKLGDFKGDFLIVVFWSKHCLPCIREMDNLAQFSKLTSSNGINTIIISREDEWRDTDEQYKFLRKYDGETLDFYVDREGKLAKDFGIFSSPHTVLFNKSGEEIGRIRGAVNWDDQEVMEQIYKIKAQNG